MKRRSGNFGAVLILLILIGVAIGMGIFIFDYIGIFDAKKIAMREIERIPYINEKLKKPDTINPAVQVQEWGKIAEAVELQKKSIDKEKEEIEKLKAQLEEKEKLLESREIEIADKEKQFDERVEASNSREARIQKQVKYYSIMRPEDSANLLPRLPQPMVIEILKRMDDELVVQILSLMDNEVSAELLRKMNKK